jgi:methionyl-tRNA formyltransferase
MMRVVFCGTGEIGLPALKALLDSGKYELPGVITQPDKPAGRDLKPRASAIKQLAVERGIPVHQPPKLRDAASLEMLRSLKPDVMVVVAYGQILPKSVLELPPLGCLNLHASILPRHRGASPIHAAILAGDAITGMTVMYMDEGLDTGDVLLEETLEIGMQETTGELHDRLAALAAPCLLQALELLAAGNAPRMPQAPEKATYAPKLKKADGFLDWTRPASELALRVRGMSPWPGAFARISGHVLKVHSAIEDSASGIPGSVLQADANSLVVACAAGSLRLLSVQLEGRKRLPVAEFLRGFPLTPGARFDLSFSPEP